MSDGEAPAGVTHISFGPGPTEEIPADWAEKILTWLKDEKPQVFMQGLRHAMGIERG